MFKKFLLAGAAVSVGACAFDQPVVTGFNGDSVEIQVSQLGGEPAVANAQSEANRICGMRGFAAAEYASTRPDNYNYVNHNLYICTNTASRSNQDGSYFSQL